MFYNVITGHPYSFILDLYDTLSLKYLSRSQQMSKAKNYNRLIHLV